MPIWLLLILEIIKFLLSKLLFKKPEHGPEEDKGFLEKMKERARKRKDGIGSPPGLV